MVSKIYPLEHTSTEIMNIYQKIRFSQHGMMLLKCSNWGINVKRKNDTEIRATLKLINKNVTRVMSYKHYV